MLCCCTLLSYYHSPDEADKTELGVEQQGVRSRGSIRGWESWSLKVAF